jgi:hypothetical protein
MNLFFCNCQIFVKIFLKYFLGSDFCAVESVIKSMVFRLRKILQKILPVQYLSFNKAGLKDQ